MKVSRRQFGLTALISLALPRLRAMTIATNVQLPKVADIGEGIQLNYVESGSGTPVIFVHGSLSDYTYWQGQMEPFAAAQYHTIAYSRRYNFPNRNPERTGYSAITDADDLAKLVRALGVDKIVVVGHSYGAFSALFLAIRHPELVRAMVLAEAPAVSLLNHLSGKQAATGKAMFHDIQTRMVSPMKAAFAKGDRNAGIGVFMGYVFNDPDAWSKMSQASRDETLRDAHEWDVVMTTGTLFPEIDPASIQKISIPVLLLSGGKSYPFLGLIDERLSQLLPSNQHIVFPDSGHQMWLLHPDLCRNSVETFLRRNGVVRDS
jgi:pimeloyl-ACP methyl ester carboxylesterase